MIPIQLLTADFRLVATVEMPSFQCWGEWPKVVLYGARVFVRKEEDGMSAQPVYFETTPYAAPLATGVAAHA